MRACGAVPVPRVSAAGLRGNSGAPEHELTARLEELLGLKIPFAVGFAASTSYLPACFVLSPRRCVKRCKSLLAKVSLLVPLLMSVSFFGVTANSIEATRARGQVDPALQHRQWCRDALGAAPASFGPLLPLRFLSVLERKGVLNLGSTALPLLWASNSAASRWDLLGSSS